MSNKDIRFEHIKVKDLQEFAERVLGNSVKGQFVPITMQRAIAHANNPYAAKNDVALLVAIDSDEDVVGYFGILPLLLRNGDEFFKANWFTTWSVSSKVRGRGVGAQLMAEALNLKQDYLIVGSVHARRVCQKYGFWEGSPLTYYWLDTTGMGHLNPLVWARRAYRKLLHVLRINREIKLKTTLIERIDSGVGPVLKRMFYTLITGPQVKVLADIRFEEVDQIQREPATPLNRPQVELHRGVDAVNWMLKNPWVIGNGRSITEEMDYFFSDTRPLYRLIALDVFSPEDEYKGFAVFSISQKGHKMVLRTLDYCFTQPSDKRYVLALAVHYGRQYLADIIEIPAEASAELHPSLIAKILLNKKTRIYQCMPKDDHSPLAQAWEDITLKLVDGDMAFS
ncbi:MAG: GNAT family N-acetyltransferase [Anaerolineales bacterium]|nr:GNAT family N-acetyltransferase [Chloroflexota bacterium]MBL6980575.1 GNAT family N-acetyltransferase [Anaerolineales bacterium]